MKIRLVQFFVFLFVLILPLAALAQTSGQITGTVRDNTGAVVVGAQVTISNIAKGITRTTTTNASGDYLVAGLGANAYDVTVTAQGFQKYSAKGVVLEVGEKARVDVNLTVGAVNTEVVVSGEAIAQVETQSSDLTGTVTGTQISQIALNGRNFTQLVALVPGVSNQTGQDEGVVGVNGSIAYSINGGRTEYNNWEIDGGDNMDNGSNGTLNVYPNLDAIAEFKVLTSNYGAQYGRNASGTVEVETKSGTNAFHGTADYFGRNEMFNAYDFFDDHTQPKPSYKKHDFGYTIGGPVIFPGYNKGRNKTFFFWSQEWRRERNPQPFHPNVPSDAERGGDFSDLCPDVRVQAPDDPMANCPTDPRTGLPFDGSLGPLPIDPVAAALLPMIPQANAVNENYPAYRATISTPTTWREELVRIDHNVTDKVRATFRYIHDSWNTVTPTPLWGPGDFPTIQTNFTGPGVSVVARLTANITPTLLNEFVASYTTDHILLTNNGPWQRPQGMTVGLFQNGFGGKLPGFQITGGTPYGNGFGQDPEWIPWNNANPTYTFRDNVSKIVGRHNLQFGAYAVMAQKNEMDGFAPSNNGFITTDNTSAVSTGNSFADLLLGELASFQQENLQLKYYFRYKIVEPYFQDDWHVTNKLTLNLGLRISMFGTYRERYKQANSFEQSAYVAGNTSVDPNTGLVIGDPFNGMIQCGAPGIPPGCMKGHLFNPAPRIGFAWDPKGNGKMAVRGGYGIFYEHTNGNEGNVESLEGMPPLVLIPVQNNIDGYANVGSNLGAQLPLSVRSIPTKAIWPYMQQWHLDVQKELPSNLVAAVSYVGSKGTHLTLQRNLNQLHPVLSSQNPYSPGEAIDTTPLTGNTDCSTLAVNGVVQTAPVANNLAIAACGADANIFRPIPGYGDVTRLENTANSIYNSLQASLRRTVGALNLSVAYTYSHSIDNSSDRYNGDFVDSYNLARNRASSNFDQRHMFVVSYVYDLPFFKQGPAHIALGGWRVSGATSVVTGTPFGVTNGTAYADAAGVANGVGTGSYADIVGDPKSGVTRGGGIGPRLYNPDAYAIPQGLTFGDSGRNSLRNPRNTNFDMSVFKRFPIHESVAFEFRWDLFNLFNHTQFSGIDGGLGSSTFLEATGAHAARRMQFGAKFIF